MNTATVSTIPAFGLKYWIEQALKTRRIGHTYVHAGARQEAPFAWKAFEHGDIVFIFTGWGRSLLTGGHKYKVHARRNGKPVSTKELASL